jgi:hypothetical protein
MRTIKRLLPIAAVLALCAAMNGCILIPEIKEKIVQLALSKKVAVGLTASGTTGTHDDTKIVDIRDSVNVAQALEAAGIDAADVKSIKISGVEYRITRADPNATREIVNGTVTVQRFGGPVANLITAFNVAAGAVTGWNTVIPEAAGVTELNNLLADILTELQGGAAANEIVTVHVTGQSVTSPPTPGSNTDFDYEIQVTISIVGDIHVDVPE